MLKILQPDKKRFTFATMKLSQLKLNKANPRFIRDEKFKKLLSSVKDFPKMMELRPIVYDTDGTILGGNMRYRALVELGFKEIPNGWAVSADSLTDEEKKRFIIEDNVGFGEWDMDMLAGWDSDELTDWGVDIPQVWHEANTMTDSDVDLTEEFDPIGIMKDVQRVVFIFNNATEAEEYLTKLGVDYKKTRIAWQVNLLTQSI